MHGIPQSGKRLKPLAGSREILLRHIDQRTGEQQARPLVTAPRVSLGAHHKLVFAYLVLVLSSNQRNDEIQTRKSLQTGKAQLLGNAQSKSGMVARLGGTVLHEGAMRLAESRSRLPETTPCLRPAPQLNVYQRVCARFVPARHKQQRLYACAQRDTEAHLTVLKVAF